MAQFKKIDSEFDYLSQAVSDYNNQRPNARGNLIDALTTLLRRVEGPPAYLSRVRLSPLLNMCILMALETGIIQTIVQRNGNQIRADELARVSRQQESAIARIMRLLTVNGICDEKAPKTYCSNPTAALLATPEQIGATRNTVDLMFPIGGKLVSQLRTAQGLSQFKDSEDDVTPFRAAYGMSMFEYLQTNEEHKKAFDYFMAGRRSGIRKMWFDYYPLWDRLLKNAAVSPESVFIVDVGGGKGHDLVDLRQRQDTAQGRLILQDLPSTLKDVDLSSASIEVMPHDFFNPQPIHGARAYYFRSIFHDWSDRKSRNILLHTAKAMKSGYSRIIIEDMVVPDANAGWRAASVDVLMFMMVEGVERSLDHWRDLLQSAGLKITGIWQGGDGTESTIEASLEEEPALASL